MVKTMSGLSPRDREELAPLFADRGEQLFERRSERRDSVDLQLFRDRMQVKAKRRRPAYRRVGIRVLRFEAALHTPMITKGIKCCRGTRVDRVRRDE